MSCLFGCFRVNDSRNHNHVPLDEPLVVSRKNRNALSSLFMTDDGELLGKAEKGCDSIPVELDFRELKNEAKFLKACGTIPETPVEIRKGSEKWEDISAKIGEGDFSKFDLEKMSNESPKPYEVCKESESAGGSLDETPRSCMTDGHSSRRVSISPASGLTSDVKNVITYADGHDTETGSATSSGSAMVFAPTVQGNLKLVHSDCKFDESALSSNDSTSSQYIYSVQNGYEKNDSEWKDLKAETSDFDRAFESAVINDVAIFKSKKTTKDVSLTKQDGYEEEFGSFLGEKPVYERTSGDRPILGMVAAHWKDDDCEHTSPVVWDGNGIPNSTNKYKEDQKVSWHVTPFEERLEKALSEGSFASNRNKMNGTPPVEFNETEESDTAMSHLQSPAHFKPVVSF